MSQRVSAKLRLQVQREAAGRCEYYLIHEDDSYAAHQIDHILARKHGGATTQNNLAYACLLCNRYKGSDVAALDPDRQEIVPLFHPRRQQWKAHFSLQGAMIVPLSRVGRATVALLRINSPERIFERQELIEAGRYGQV